MSIHIPPTASEALTLPTAGNHNGQSHLNNEAIFTVDGGLSVGVSAIPASDHSNGDRLGTCRTCGSVNCSLLTAHPLPEE